MKYAELTKLAATFALVTLLAACGKEAPPAAVEEDVAADEQPVETEIASDDEAVEEATDDTLEVVEESAADAEESADEAIVLARAETPAQTIDYKYREGEHYTRLVPTQPTVGGADKIEVAEFFWYGCAHCFDFEPYINEWEKTGKPASVRFVRVPAMWNQVLRTHAQLFYTEEALVRNGAIKDPHAFRASVFEEFHNRGNRLLTEDAIVRHFARFGVSEEDFNKAWNSFEVAQQLRKAADLARRYGVSGVPAIIVNGKYRTGGAEAGSYPNLIEVIDELVVRESAR
ncbi:MAG: thiol:disulfide interchange protein DsbA/DsbL [Woeseiaceae bacterium]|nr:thiol:disulfide interchange protein DsbA/DsbL [Woeseiaceae bacterium]